MDWADRFRPDPYLRDQRLKPAVAAATDRRHAAVDFQHLLWADAEAADSLLAVMVAHGTGGPRRDWPGFRAGLKRYLDGLPALPRPAAPVPSAALLAALAAAADKSPDAPVTWPALLATVLDVKAHEVVPLVVLDYRLTAAAVPAGGPAVRVPVGGGGAPVPPPADGGLARFCTDLTDQARAGAIGACLGRDRELRRLLTVLGCKEANNPLLLGDAGVGKTRIVEGLALAIATGTAPDRLKDKRLLALDLGLLVAGATHRGEFEERLHGLLGECRQARGGVLLFVDEIHQLLGLGRAGGGAMDAANLMKPALARGELWCIGATTYEEYRLVEADPAFRRRFQPVDVPELDPESVAALLEKVAPAFGRHHGVVYTGDALRTVGSMARRYLGELRAPARELALLDQIGAEVGLDRAPGPDPEVDAGHVAAAIAARTGVPVQRLSLGLKERLDGLADRLAARVFGQRAVIDVVAAGLRRSLTGLTHPDRPRAVFLFAGPSGVGKTELAKAMAEELFDTPAAVVRLDLSEFNAETARNRLIGSDPGYVGYEEGGRLTEAVRRRPYSLVLLDEFEKAHPAVWRLFLQVLDDGRLTDAKGRTVRFNDTVVVLTSNAGALLLDKSRAIRERLAGVTDATVAARAVEEAARGIPGFVPRYFDLLRAEADRAMGGGEAPAPAVVVREALLATPGFPPELFSRIGEPLVFVPLAREHLDDILRGFVRDLCGRLAAARNVPLPADPAKRNAAFGPLQSPDGGVSIAFGTGDPPAVSVRIGPAAREALLARGFDPLIGALAALRTLFEREVESAAADQLLGQLGSPALTVEVETLPPAR